MATSFDRLKELNLSRDEVTRLGEALKKQEFRQLLADYVEEIQDPDNRAKYEQEVKELEKERGQEVTFLHPTSGYVIKTSVDGRQKGFINICSNTNINKPTSLPIIKNGSKGLQWQLPHSLSPPHEDLDAKGARCQVYDVVFHPDTLHLASNNSEFRSMVNLIALEAVENNFGVTLDKANLKFPKLAYKGIKRASIIRKPSKELPTEKTPEEQELFNRIYEEIDAQQTTIPTPKSKPRKKPVQEYTTPQYLIKHRSHVDIQDFTEHKTSKFNAAIPKELVIEINLPLLKSSNDITLDVTTKTLKLTSEKPAKYKLDLTLPYHVHDLLGSAQFDKDTKKLVITLPVKRLECVKYDSGIESDLNSPADDKRFITELDDKCVIEAKRDDFLNSSEFYNLPEFVCNIFDNTLAFTFNIKNVNEETVHQQVLKEQSLIKVKFTSISSTFYPTSYAFFLKLPQQEIIEEDIIVETWDNNVILQVPLIPSSQAIQSYYYGLNESSLIEKYIEEPAMVVKSFEQLQDEESQPEIVQKEPPVQSPKSSSSAIDIFTTSYESSGDELSASSFSPRKSKGILKRLPGSRSKFGRSVSESSLDDFISSSFENYHGSIECVPEDSREMDDEAMSSSLKKTVRFNDVVVKQLFRSNSSILGQKKKNQRKARNKKRAHDRRYSESEASDVETKKENDELTVNKTQETEDEDSSHEPTITDKKDDTDIFHLEINN